MSPTILPEVHAPHCGNTNKDLHPKEFWLTYHQISRAHRPSTAQLVELDIKSQKLNDLESILEHVFQQGFVDPKYRASTWWERRDGTRVKSSHSLDELFKQGVGKCQDSALRLVIADMPPALWFTYSYVNSPTGHVVSQRIKFDSHNTYGNPFEKLAHITNHIFERGYLPAKYRTLVHWEGHHGKKLLESTCLPDVFVDGVGVSEDYPLRLVIDNSTPHKCACGCRGSETQSQVHGQVNGWSSVRYT